METYFNIKYLFGKHYILQRLDEQIHSQIPAYICVADGNVVNMVQHSESYCKVLNDSLFSICDSGWIPIYLHWIYGIEREQYCGPMFFKDVVSQGKYRMFFMGTNQKTLNGLKNELSNLNPQVQKMSFYELPFLKVEDFDYEGIARMLDVDGADVIWVALGAPKQDEFMNRLLPYLKKGILIGVGAAFNFFSGVGEKRAPEWVTKNHLEFIYRIGQSPKKQIQRCWGIIVGMPSLLLNEYRRKRRLDK